MPMPLPVPLKHPAHTRSGFASSCREAAITAGSGSHKPKEIIAR